MSKFILRNILFLTVFFAIGILSQKCPANYTRLDTDYVNFDYWRSVAVLGKSVHDDGRFNIFNGLHKVMNCLTAEIYSWFDVGLIIQLNCIMEEFQISNCPRVYISYSGINQIPNTTNTPNGVMTGRPVKIIKFKPHKYIILYDCNVMKNGELEEGVLVLVNDISYWQYDRPEIEYEIRAIPFIKTLSLRHDTSSMLASPEHCQCAINSCYFTDSDNNMNTTIEKTKTKPQYKSRDFKSELYTIGTIFLILFLVIILSNGIIAIHKKLKAKRVVSINSARPSG
ncbi:unnamed protein product [Diamesa tonsa]